MSEKPKKMCVLKPRGSTKPKHRKVWFNQNAELDLKTAHALLEDSLGHEVSSSVIVRYAVKYFRERLEREREEAVRETLGVLA